MTDTDKSEAAMSDEELLRLAAKAAGIGGGWEWPRGAKQPTFWRDSNGRAWQPLTDDGDALRLAVRLEIDIEFEGSPDIVWADENWSEPGGDDPYAATRRAITRAAAEIQLAKEPR